MMMAASMRRPHITRADVGGPKAMMASVRIQGGDGLQLIINLPLELHSMPPAFFWRSRKPRSTTR
jgi:hypothetical protein